MRYGMPYMGSKNDIAKYLIDILPAGERFVDLFGGGAAMTHAACLSNKWKKVYYNELNPLVVDLFKRSISGEFSKTKPEWISREKSKERRDKDGMIAYVWSFGNKGGNYLYSKEIEPWKEALHYARVFNDRSKLLAFGIDSDGSREDIKRNEERYKERYIVWYCRNVLKSSLDVLELQKNLRENIKKNEEELREYLVGGLKRSGKRASDVDRYLGTNGMAGHYFGRSQWEFPTREVYIKLQGFIDLPDPYEKVYGLQSLLESLERLERLQSLQRLESLESLEINRGSYTDYKYRSGDVVYCDPPYEGTAQYDADGFDSKAFYDWVASRPYRVFFSSYDISDTRFVKIWERVRNARLSPTSNTTPRVEKLYCNRPFQVIENDQYCFDFGG